MIPPFEDSGYLPAGIHPATLGEIEARFGRQSELRRVQMESVRSMIDLAVRAGVERIILNGSFVTDTIEPNDVDCALLVGPGFRWIRPRKPNCSMDFHFWTCCCWGQRSSSISLAGFLLWTAGIPKKA